jgi:hypothetical protein
MADKPIKTDCGSPVVSSALLACPFCGGSDISEVYYEESEFPTTLRALICACGCEYHGTQDERGTMRTEWNRRANKENP